MERQLNAYSNVALRYEDILQLLERSPHAIFEHATNSASEHAAEVLSTITVPVGGFELGRQVTVAVGTLKRTGEHRAQLPISWKAAAKGGLFPTMSGAVEVSALSEGSKPQSQVEFVGRYVPPIGLVGTFGDSVGALHRVAFASVQRFVEDICTRLETELGTS